MNNKHISVAFVVGTFPKISETFIIDQACDLIDRGIDVFIYAFSPGEEDRDKISKRFFEYNLERRTAYLNNTESKLLKTLLILPRFLQLLFLKPAAIFKIPANPKVLFWDLRPFFGKKHDLYHCHFGNVGSSFVMIKKVLDIKEKFITSLYGQDVSSGFIDYPNKDVYKDLKKESSAFIAMSNFMKKRIVAKGFDESKIQVLPMFGINTDNYPFKERKLEPGNVIQMATVGRFVEKKGFDDILRALAIVKNKTDKKFMCNIIGGGPLEPNLRAIAEELGLNDVVSFRGYMRLEDIINYFLKMHFYLQPSKTASDGDME